MNTESLTPMEAKCLRELLQHGKRGQVASALGVSENTVKVHLASARRKLGTSSSFEAARRFAAAQNVPPNGISPFWGMPEHQSSDAGGERQTDQPGENGADAVREEGIPFQYAPPRAAGGGGFHQGSGLASLGIAAGIAFLIVLLVLAAPPFAERLGWLGDLIYHHH